MTTTTRDPVSVAYHADGYGPHRPAINVKVYIPFHDVPAYRDAYARLSASPFVGEEGADFLGEIAWNMLVEEFWWNAKMYADELALGTVEQEGRGGGWLVLPDVDPQDQDMTPNERRAWLRAYSTLRDWCEEQIAGAPAATAALMLDMAADRGVTP